MSVSNMKSNPPRPNEEPYVGKLLVRFREGLGRQLPGLLENNKLNTKKRGYSMQQTIKLRSFSHYAIHRLF
jgi:hypothetical protein